MPILDDEALVLDHYPLGDRHLILAVLTRRSGTQRGVLRNARGGKAPAAAAAQILSLVRVSLYQRPHADLATFRHLDLVRSSYPLAADLRGSAASAVVAELLLTYCPPAEPEERFFRLGAAALDGLLADADPDLVVAYTEFWVLALGGVLPAPDETASAIGKTGFNFLGVCRNAPIGNIHVPVPARVAGWLDRRVRDEAERPLRALDFFRRHTE
ncbi:MAG: DNA repair protein RecO [Thermoanaerobaculales bacterium]